MPEEPQNMDQSNQPLQQPQSQPPSGNQPEMTVGSEQQNIGNVPVTPIQTTYASQPQFETESQTPTQTQTEPTVTNPIFSQSQPNQTARNSKKGLLIAAIAAGTLILLGGGSVLAYNIYSTPEKVVSDAIVNAITAKNPIYTGKLTMDSDSLKATVEITAKQLNTTGSFDAKVNVTYNGKDFAITGGAIFDKAGDLYFKVGGLGAVGKQFESENNITINGLDAFVTKIDNKWVKISSEDLSKYNDSLATSKNCVNDTINKFKDDKTVLTEISDLYAKNPFIKINKELGQKDGSFGYDIKTDSNKSKSFVEGFKTTKIYTEIHNCDNSFTIDPTDVVAAEDSGSTGTFELWVNTWSHQITEIKASSPSTDSQKISVSIKPLYNQDIKIDTPTDSITLAQLQTEIETLMSSMQYSGSYSDTYSDTYTDTYSDTYSDTYTDTYSDY